MKNINKRLVSLFLAVVLVIGLATPLASAANPAPKPGTAKWTDIGGNIKCYTRSTGNTITYTSAELGTRSGYVDGVDEIIVKVISTNSKGNWYAKINYKVNSGGTKDAYVPLSAVCISTSAQAGVEKRAGVNIPIVYKRPGEKYVGSSIDAGDDVYIIGTSGAYTQIMYPIGHNGRNPGLNSNTWKLGWIKTVDAQHSLVSKQCSSSWSGYAYGRGQNDDGSWYNATISTSACGVLALINCVYYLNGMMIPPEVLAKYAKDHQCRPDGGGTLVPDLAAKYFADNAYGTQYGVRYMGTVTSLNSLKTKLQSGCVAVVPVPGHFIAVVAYNSATNQYLIFDSYPSENRKTSTGLRWTSSFTGSIGITAEMTIIGRR